MNLPSGFTLGGVIASLIIVAVLSGCSLSSLETPQVRAKLTTENLSLSEFELRQIVLNGTLNGCTHESYQTSEFSPLAQYSFCNYTIFNPRWAEVVTQISKFTNKADVDGSYQYESLHLRGFQGLIEENSLGDYSRFYVNNESDVYYHHLWIVKDVFLIHVTSKGTVDDADVVYNMGQGILSRFDEQ